MTDPGEYRHNCEPEMPCGLPTIFDGAERIVALRREVARLEATHCSAHYRVVSEYLVDVANGKYEQESKYARLLATKLILMPLVVSTAAAPASTGKDEPMSNTICPECNGTVWLPVADFTGSYNLWGDSVCCRSCGYVRVINESQNTTAAPATEEK